MRRNFLQSLFIALLLPLALGVAAKDSTGMESYVGTWQLANVPGSTDLTVTTSSVSPQLKLALPENMTLLSGQTVLLDRVDTATFRATDKSGVVVQFSLKSSGHAELTMKSSKPGVWQYFDTDLTRL
ncbi:MAG: hypothetical protein WA777_18025 [Rhodanobacter sp.]